MNTSTHTDSRDADHDATDTRHDSRETASDSTALADPATERERVTSFLQNSVTDAAANGVVVNMSGGLDSTVVAAAAVEALGPDRVYGLILPCNKAGTLHARDAEGLAEALEIEYDTIHLQPLFAALGSVAPDRFDLHDEPVLTGNAIARLRMTMAYLAANATNRLVCGTSNRSERLLGYVTKYGDGAADLLPIGHLYKTEVRLLADELGVPEFVVEKPPTAGILVGQRDVDDLGAPYEVIDAVLRAVIDEGIGGVTVDEDVDSTAVAECVRSLSEDGMAVDTAVVSRLLDRYRSTEHKRSVPPMPTMPTGRTRE
ncbi:MAG: NAD(+) synthase [Halorubrum sp.]